MTSDSSSRCVSIDRTQLRDRSPGWLSHLSMCNISTRSALASLFELFSPHDFDLLGHVVLIDRVPAAFAHATGLLQCPCIEVALIAGAGRFFGWNQIDFAVGGTTCHHAPRATSSTPAPRSYPPRASRRRSRSAILPPLPSPGTARRQSAPRSHPLEIRRRPATRLWFAVVEIRNRSARTNPRRRIPGPLPLFRIASSIVSAAVTTPGTSGNETP